VKISILVVLYNKGTWISGFLTEQTFQSCFEKKKKKRLIKKLSVILEHPVPTVVAGHGEDVQSWQAHTTLAGSPQIGATEKRSEMVLGTLLLQKLY
jgi:hypothetical protein